MLFNSSENVQTTLLDREGNILSSCNTLLNMDDMIGQPAHQFLPMLEAIIYTFHTNFNQKKIHLPRIEAPLPELEGFYDFIFEVVKINDQPILRWIIYDFTLVYEALQRKQQQEHEKKLKGGG